MTPRFSVLTAVHDPPRDELAACLASVRAQTVADWEHVLVDDGSTAPWVAALLEEASARDPRVVVVRRATNGGIVAASNDALAAARGELIALLDHDDVLDPTALARMDEAFTADATVDVAYSDHDLLRPDGRLADPFLKPDWSPERLRSQNYVTHLLVARRDLVAEVGGFRPGFDGAQDHDLLLRLTERARRVAHVPVVLYHWRQSARSVASDTGNKPDAYERGRRAVQEHCDRIGEQATVELGPFDGTYRVRRRVHGEPLVSVIVPTRGTSGTIWGCRRTFVVDAVRSLLEHSTYQHLEVVVVHDTDTPPEVLRALGRVAGDRLVLVPFDAPFNFSAKINLGAAYAHGEVFLLLNDDTELIEPESVEVLLGLVQSPGVGMAGAKLLFADGTLQHGGHVYHHERMHACFGWPGDHPGPGRVLAVERECSGVTAAAAMVTRAVFEEVGGFWEDLPVNFNDVDFSLQVRATGRRIVWTPYACWYHFESRSRDGTATMDEFRTLDARWHDQMLDDPYYHPLLTPRRSDWLERPGHSGAPPFTVGPDGRKRWA